MVYNILTESGKHVKLVRPIKIRLNETYSKVCKNKNLTDSFSVQNDLK
jgi:hypothetical protein